MLKSPSRKSARTKARARYAARRAQGLRLIRIWVPDVRSPEFIKEARRQSRLVAESPHAADDQAFIDSISELKFE
jgi:hypothetical protein